MTSMRIFYVNLSFGPYINRGRSSTPGISLIHYCIGVQVIRRLCLPLQPWEQSRYVFLVWVCPDNRTKNYKQWSSSWWYSKKQHTAWRLFPRTGDGASVATEWRNQGYDQMLDRLKLVLVYILESVVRCHHKKTAINLFYVKIVHDIDAFNNYPWDWKCFEDIVYVFTRSHSKSKRSVYKYDTYGLPLSPIG